MSGINTSPPHPAPADEYRAISPPLMSPPHSICTHDVGDHNTSAYPQAPREIISPNTAGSSAADIATVLGDMKTMIKTLTDSIHVAESMRAKWQDEILRIEAHDHMEGGMEKPRKRRRGMTLKQAARQNVLRPMHISKQQKHKKSTSTIPPLTCSRSVPENT